MRTSEKDSVLKEETIGKKLRGRGASVLVCSMGTGEADPYNIISSLPTSQKFAMLWQFAETSNFFGGGLKNILFRVSSDSFT